MLPELQVSVLGAWIGADSVPVLAFIAGFLVFTTIGVVQMIRVRTKWTWRHIAKDAAELLLAVSVTIAIAGVASYVTTRIADRLGLNDLESNYLRRVIGSTAILCAWLAWTHRRIRGHRRERHSASIRSI
ncbi:MAG TPA: hypothetical protein VNZ03_18015 [Terriglobales bacterium]|jgi:hypothetical protein|nr:hypothetical protein [Terriglobales bacterium]